MMLAIIPSILVVSLYTTLVLSLYPAQWLESTNTSPNSTNQLPSSIPSSDSKTTPKSAHPASRNSNNTSSPLTDPLSYLCYTSSTDIGPVSIPSCTDAVRQLDIRSSTPLLWGPRNTGAHYQLYLPQRFISGDGRCFIEPILRTGYDSSYTSQQTLATAVLMLVRKCAAGTPSKNGAAKNIGDDDQLAVVLNQYVTGVRCDEGGSTASRWKRNCKEVLDSMDVEEQERRFGPAAARGGADVVLPKELKAGYLDRCVVTVRTTETGAADFVSWREIWEAAAAVNAMCVRLGKGGVWGGLGGYERIEVRITGDYFQEE